MTIDNIILELKLGAQRAFERKDYVLGMQYIEAYKTYHLGFKATSEGMYYWLRYQEG